MTQAITVVKHGAIAVLGISNPPVNALSHPVRVELMQTLATLFADDGTQGIVISCEGRTFIAGADIREFGKPPLAPDLPELVEFLDTAPKPVIAAIHGTALGGGLELALACHFRVAATSAKLGLPEVTLGILPGAGGTQRLPRLIGVRAALELLVDGRPIGATAACALGLVDEVTDGDWKTAAIALAERVLSEGRRLRRASALTAQLDDPNLLLEFERAVARRRRGFLAPLRCVEAVRAAVELPFTEGLKRERELFVELMLSPESKAQRHVFFAEREVAKVPDLQPDTPARPVSSAGLVGDAGTAELAACLAGAGLAVVVLGSAQQDLEELRGVDLLIEVGREDVTAKRELIARLDAIAGPTTIVASSASFVGLDSLVSATSRPQNFVGMHFADAANGAKLLENVRGRETASDVYATVMRLGRTLGKVAVPVRGLLSARSFAQYLREAFALVEEGAFPEQVDDALQAFGFPAGPFAVLDRMGLDVVLQGQNALVDALSPRAPAMELLSLMSARGRLGRRAAAGFYRYSAEEPFPDPEISEWIVQQSEQRGSTRRNIANEEICERCWFVVVNDAARALDEGIAARPLDVDLIWIHGHGYPSYRGGPLFHSDQIGLRAVLDGIRRYGRRAEQEAWVPAPLLERLVERGHGFYSRS